jgi:hypothetical protein
MAGAMAKLQMQTLPCLRQVEFLSGLKRNVIFKGDWWLGLARCARLTRAERWQKV